MSLDDITEALRLLTKTQVLVGIPSDKEPGLGQGGPNTRQPSPDNPHGLTNAELGYIHEHGAPEANIPARPFLHPGVDRVRTEIAQRLTHAAEQAMLGNIGVVEKTFDAIGLIAQAAVRQTITDQIPPPLSPATVARRMRRTKASKYKRKATVAKQVAFNAQFEQTGSMAGSPTTPLDDTGQLLHSINYVKREV